jgi:predicted Zn finger-like uncharacterized protein
MRIACPNCAAEYEVPAPRLTPGKLVRCARCGGKWVAVPEAEEPPDADDTPAQHESHHHEDAEAFSPPMTAMDRLAASTPQRARPTGLTAAWIISFIVIIAAVAAVIVWREPLRHAWPPIGRILPLVDHPAVTQSSDSAAPSPPIKKK